MHGLVLQPLAVVLVGALALFERGRARVARARPVARAGGRREAWLLRAGVAIGVVALSSPLDALGRDDLFFRSLVEFTLAWVAAPLIVLGAPTEALAAGLRGPGRAAGLSYYGGRRVRVHPVVGLGLFVGAFWCWHLPGALDPTVRSTALFTAELACYLVGGIALWSQLVASHPFVPRLSPLGRIGLVIGVFAGTWSVAAAMVYSQSSWYGSFGGGHQVLTALEAQRFAGAVMWALPAIPLGVMTFWAFAAWLSADEEEEWDLAALTGERLAAGPGGRGGIGDRTSTEGRVDDAPAGA